MPIFPTAVLTVARFLGGCSLLALASLAQADLPVTHGSQQGVPRATKSAGLDDWRYTLRPGETVEQVGKRLLSSAHDVHQLLQHNGVSNPEDVVAGQSIRIPVNWLEKSPEPAMAIAVSGPVQHVDGVSGRRQTLTTHSRIRAGDEIATGSGFAVVQLADGSLLRLGRNTDLMFNRLTRFGKTGMVDTRMRLDRGELDAEVEKLTDKGSRFEVDTPSAVAAVRGTKFSLQSSPSKTQLQVTEGKVEFGPPGRTVGIPAGYSGTAGQGTRNPVDIRHLPPAPAPGAVPGTTNKLPLDIAWSRIDSAQAYQMDIFNADTGDWIARRTSPSPEMRLDHLDNGKYQVRLAAIDRHGNPGMPDLQSITVDQEARAANLQAPAADARVDDEMPSFSWAYQGDNEVGRVEIASSSDFSDLVATSEWAPDSNAIPSRALSPGEYYWRVVTRTGGTSSATSEPRKLVVNGTLPPARIININYVNSQVRIFWQQIESADKYQLQLSEDPSFKHIIKEANVADTTAALRLIPGRRYFVRLKALSDGPINGRWGPGRELFVN
ncbi:peptidoglycan-binding protein LysM [Marinobacter halodurans]|uniref:Peptidoglycan-binding protein LysM n=1 Tax=Marinobacter halodurans TaxID=2528979 RepID=A0ABY1ZLG7_9GAMM|nr:FecR domain-containing protein [Marinobacter halodurans]TBW56666.1 peptidoglycan-binding protein LysM [Marinobacter halodurans]